MTIYTQVKDQFWETGIRKKKEVALEVAMYPQQSKIPHLGRFLEGSVAFFVVYLRLRRNIKLSF